MLHTALRRRGLSLRGFFQRVYTRMLLSAHLGIYVLVHISTSE